MSNQTIYDSLVHAGLTPEGACGLMGNMYAESIMKANIAQRGMTKLSDEEYTAAADKGMIDFIGDGVGYGLCQWTYGPRKALLLAFCKSHGQSVGDEFAQVQFCLQELQSYPSVNSILRSSTNLKQCSDIVCTEYEKPAVNNLDERYNYALKFYNEFAHGQSTQTIQTPAFDPSIAENMLLKLGDKGDKVEAMQKRLIDLGYDVGVDGADGDFGVNTLNALKAYQQANNLSECGYFGPKTYESMKPSENQIASEKKTNQYVPGDFVNFVGNRQYSSPYFDFGKDAKPGKARVVVVKNKAKHPYCLLCATNGKSNVNGWVNAEDVEDL